MNMNYPLSKEEAELIIESFSDSFSEGLLSKNQAMVGSALFRFFGFDNDGRSQYWRL